MMATMMMKPSSPPPPPLPPLPPPPPPKKKKPPPPPPLLALIEPLLLREELLLLREELPLERLTLLRLPPPGRASTNTGDATQRKMREQQREMHQKRRRCMDPSTLPCKTLSHAHVYPHARRHPFSHKRDEIARPMFRFLLAVA